MKDLHGPQTAVLEGAYAIKVSMSCQPVVPLLLYFPECARAIWITADGGVLLGYSVWDAQATAKRAFI